MVLAIEEFMVAVDWNEKCNFKFCKHCDGKNLSVCFM
jgi:hypothetical protein